MKIHIIAVGKIKKGPALELLESFRKRTPWEINIREVEEKKHLSQPELKKRESLLLVKNTPSSSVKIAMDEKGKQFTSIDFTRLLQKYFSEGRDISFLIGGANGMDKQTIKADHTMSLGNMTWPHMLARAMLVEQLYRAYSIMENHPYHRI